MPFSLSYSTTHMHTHTPYFNLWHYIATEEEKKKTLKNKVISCCQRQVEKARPFIPHLIFNKPEGEKAPYAMLANAALGWHMV